MHNTVTPDTRAELREAIVKVIRGGYGGQPADVADMVMALPQLAALFATPSLAPDRDAEVEALRAALEPFARASRAIGNEPGPFRFETGTGFREITREDLATSVAALATPSTAGARDVSVIIDADSNGFPCSAEAGAAQQSVIDFYEDLLDELRAGARDVRPGLERAIEIMQVSFASSLQGGVIQPSRPEALLRAELDCHPEQSGANTPCRWSGGNDYTICRTCGLEYDHRKEDRPPCPRIASTAIAPPVQGDLPDGWNATALRQKERADLIYGALQTERERHRAYRATQASAKPAGSGMDVTDDMVERACISYRKIAGGTLTLWIVRSALIAALNPAPEARRWRHKKRGSNYIEVGRATLQVSADRVLRNGDRLVVYQGDQLWARPVSEFEDGRFEALNPAPEAKHNGEQ